MLSKSANVFFNDLLISYNVFDCIGFRRRTISRRPRASAVSMKSFMDTPGLIDFSACENMFPSFPLIYFDFSCSIGMASSLGILFAIDVQSPPPGVLTSSRNCSNCQR